MVLGAYMSYVDQSSFFFMRTFFSVMLYLMTKKLSGEITYQELKGLADPMRKEVDSVNK